jgi:hypothetical protein
LQNQACQELLPALTAALPDLQWVHLQGAALLPPVCAAALCAAPGIQRPITLRLSLGSPSVCDLAYFQAHMEAVQQAVTAAVAAAHLPSHVTLEWVYAKHDQ